MAKPKDTSAQPKDIFLHAQQFHELLQYMNSDAGLHLMQRSVMPMMVLAAFEALDNGFDALLET